MAKKHEFDQTRKVWLNGFRGFRSTNQSIEELVKLRDRALKNAKRQREKLYANPSYKQRIRPEFWFQKAAAYSEMITAATQRIYRRQNSSKAKLSSSNISL